MLTCLAARFHQMFLPKKWNRQSGRTLLSTVAAVLVGLIIACGLGATVIFLSAKRLIAPPLTEILLTVVAVIGLVTGERIRNRLNF